nr:PREDICTED: uncharacterized protein LOC109037649 [Bemisia tabaci]
MDVPPPIPNLNAAILAAAQILEDHINAPIAPAFSDESDDDNSDSGDEDLPIMLHTEEEEHVRNKHYVVNVVYYMSDLDFRRHFRLTRSGVEELCMELKEDEIHSEGRPSIPFEHALLLSLWLLATPESFRSVADRFGIDRGHAHVLCPSIYQKMYDRRNTWIRRPRGGYQGGYPEENDASAETVEELLESMDEELSLEDSTDFDYESFHHMVRKNNCNNINN